MNKIYKCLTAIVAISIITVFNGCENDKKATSAPAATTLSATNTTPVSAQLNGTVNANYLSTSITFEFGTSTDYGSTVIADQSPLSENSNTDTEVCSSISGLSAGKIYHYRIIAVNSSGTTFGNDITFTAGYEIGEKIYGGIVFYIDASGQHGLVCAPASQVVTAEWGCSGTTIAGADGIKVGTGNQNTTDIVKGCPAELIAAKICSDLTLDTYNDWYMPSKDELGLMYTNLKKIGLGGFANNYYWSSTEFDKDLAWTQAFDDGSKGGGFKNEKRIVRAIRAF